ncbi:MAG: DUF882 domain-containing protein [Rhizobiaceae bacterium]|nr:DUF882 domain-containing protein [Rhizobiaceae bacterium]
MVALFAALLASCSATSDPVARLGLTPPDLSTGQLASAAADAQADEDDGVAAATASQPYFIVGEDDPELPDIASSVPTLQNRPEPAAEAATQVAAAQPLVPGVPAPGTQVAPGQPASERFAPDQAAPVAQPLASQAAGAVAAVEQPAQTAFAAPQPKKRGGFFSNLFASEPYQPRAAQRPQVQPVTAFAAAAAPGTTGLAASATAQRTTATREATAPGALPGVRESQLFEIRRGNGAADESDIDLHEDDDGEVQVASAAGLARLAPNGLVTQTDRVDVACLKPSLVRVLKQIEGRYGKKVMVTSGYRSPPNNRRARGAKNSLHMYCAAADIKVEGVTKFELAQYLRTMPGRGGVGTYCHTNAVHIDVGPERDWNWRCRRKKRR